MLFRSFEIIKDFYGNTGIGGFSIENTYDNDFSLEVWFHPKTLTNSTPIFAKEDDTGIYWDNGNIKFKVDSYIINYTVPQLNKAYHVVGIYTGSSIKLYVDGSLVSTLSTGKIKFSSQSLTFMCGPSNNNEYFLVDSPAIYRYSLNDLQISNHYFRAQTNSESQIVLPDGGKIFKATSKHQEISEKFMYPVNKSWSYFTNDDLSYDEVRNVLYLNENSTYGSYTQIIGLLHWKTYISSKIEWVGSYGVKIYVSETGEEN